MDIRAIFERFGYNPDDPVPYDEWMERVIPDRLLDVIGAPRSLPPVSAAELRTLELVSHGVGVDGAADLAYVSANTIRSQLLSARRKLRAKNTTHACCLALRQGLIH